MSGLVINGLTVPVRAETYQETIRDVGEVTQAFDGSVRRSRIATKRDAGFDTYALPSADAYAWEQLLRGLGEVWRWEESYYGSKGTGATAKTNTGFDSGKFDEGLYMDPAGTPQYITYTLTASSAWTVMVWRKVAAGAWAHYIVTSGGKKWVDGVRNDAASTTWLTHSSGAFTLTGDTVSQVWWDDLVIFPYLIIDAWGPTLGTQTSAYPLAPKLTATGDAIPETSRTVLGSVETARVIYAFASGSNAAHRELTVTLQES